MAVRTIFHVDVNSAFLSWSAVKRLEEDPSAVDLRTIPSAVGGDVNTRHGIITARSIPAKKFGVKTGEPVVKALQKCPGLVLVRSDFATYRKKSGEFIDILRRWSTQLEQVSIDEAYLDMSEAVEAELERVIREEGSSPGPLTAEEERFLRRQIALVFAHRIREEVKEKLKFTVNVGVSENKLLAKMASDFEKPDNVHTLFPDEVEEKLWPLPIGELHGCGSATSARLNNVGIRTIGDAAASTRAYLQSVLGNKAGDYIWHSANGRSESPVQSEEQEAKSYSNEVTTAEDITAENYPEEAPRLLHSLSEKVAGRLKRDDVRGATIGVMIKTSAFRRHSRQTTLPDATNDAETIEEVAGKLLDDLLLGTTGLFAAGVGIRLLGVSVSGLDDGAYRQMDLFSWQRENAAPAPEETAPEQGETVVEAAEGTVPDEKKLRLEEMLKKVRGRYGAGAISLGMDRPREERKGQS